jgi:DNA polymerase III delta subunit
LYWVVGPVRRLVEEVIDLIVARIGADPYDRVRLTAGETPERDIWSAINQYPAGGPRIVVVREAERLQRWEQLADWREDRALRDSHVLFVSSEDSSDTSLDYLHLIVTKGKFVKCGPYNPPKKGQRDMRVDTLKARMPITDPAARTLLDRTRGDMDAALDFADKCRLFTGTIDERLVKAVVEVAPADNFVEAVIAFQPVAAFQALAVLPEEEYSTTIGMLDYQLDCLSRLYRALRKADNIRDNKARRTREIIKQSRLEQWQVGQFLPYARRYDPPQVRTCIEALALADSKVSEGETDLVMELLVSFWMTRAA